MVNTSELVEEEVRLGIVDSYAHKLINSEYGLESTRGFIIGGLKGYERLLSLSKDIDNPRWKPLHMAANWNSKNRRTTKMLAKTNWFKGKTVVEPPTTTPSSQNSKKKEKPIPSNPQEGYQSDYDAHSETQGGVDKELSTSHQEGNIANITSHEGESRKPSKNGKRRGANRDSITLGGLKKIEIASKRRAKQRLSKKLGKLDLPSSKKDVNKVKKKGPPPPTISVCFIDNTANGILVRRMQGVEEEVSSKVDYRVRMTEAAGTPLSLLLTNNNPWGTKDCQREDCQTCAQGDEKQIDCKKRNVLYESYCTLCNPVEVKRGKKDEITFLKEGKGVYVGESSRSLYERTGEHVADRVAKKEESHQIKHWLLDHADLEEPPKFKFRLIKSFKDPMSRQLAEAVRIELRGSDILNSKAEFNRSRVPRLRVDMEGWKQAQKKEPTSLQEGSLEEEYEASILEERQAAEEETEVKQQKKPKV